MSNKLTKAEQETWDTLSTPPKPERLEEGMGFKVTKLSNGDFEIVPL